jgi:hypothetical protein
MPSAFVDFLKRYRKDGNEFLNHIVRVTGDVTWVSIMNVETQKQSKQWKHITFTRQAEKVDGNCFLGQKRSADGGIHAKRDHTNVRNVLRKTKKIT